MTLYELVPWMLALSFALILVGCCIAIFAAFLPDPDVESVEAYAGFTRSLEEVTR